jgi:hypothetical protein
MVIVERDFHRTSISSSSSPPNLVKAGFYRRRSAIRDVSSSARTPAGQDLLEVAADVGVHLRKRGAVLCAD